MEKLSRDWLKHLKLGNDSLHGSLLVWGSLTVGSALEQMYRQWRFKADQGMWTYVFGRKDGTGGCFACYKMAPDGEQDVWMVKAFTKHPRHYEGGLPDFDDEDGMAVVRTPRTDLTGAEVQVRRECHGSESLFAAIHETRAKLSPQIIWRR